MYTVAFIKNIDVEEEILLSLFNPRVKFWNNPKTYVALQYQVFLGESITYRKETLSGFRIKII